jgi:hypothetical protein
MSDVFESARPVPDRAEAASDRSSRDRRAEWFRANGTDAADAADREADFWDAWDCDDAELTDDRLDGEVAAWGRDDGLPDRDRLAELAGAPSAPTPPERDDPAAADRGFDLDGSGPPGDHDGDAAELAALEAEFDALDDPSLRPDDERPLHKSGWLQAAIVAGGTALVFGIGGFVLTASNSSGTADRDRPVEMADVEPATEIPDSPDDDIGALKTELALGKQEAALQRLDETRDREGRSVRSRPSATSRSADRDGAVRRTAPPRSPSISTTARSLPRPSARRSRSVAAPPARSVTSPLQPSRLRDRVDPQAAWLAAARAGTATAAGARDRDAAVDRPTDAPEILADAEARILNSDGERWIATGTAVAATVVAPSIWAAGTDRDHEGDAVTQRGLVRLEEPLRDDAGEVVLPAGAALVVELDAVNEANGLAALTAVAAIAGDRELSLPEGAVAIRADDGDPFFAEPYDDRGDELAALDVGQALLGAVSTAAELVNRPRETSTIDHLDGGETIATRQRNGDPDLLAGAIAGGFETLRDRVAERNDRAIEEILSRPVVWYVATERPVTLWVERGFSL